MKRWMLVAGRARLVSRQTKLLAAMGLIDLALTLWLVHAQDAWEGNPLMALALQHSTFAFVAAKLSLLAAPLALLEWARRRNPAFVARAANLAILGYVLVYAVGMVQANFGGRFVTEIASSATDARISALMRKRSALKRLRGPAGEGRKITAYAPMQPGTTMN